MATPPKLGKKGTDTDGENNAATIKPSDGGVRGNGSPTGDSRPPTPGSKAARMLDDIQRIATNLADDLALLGKVHAILVKAEAKAAREAASGNGRSKSKRKATRGKAA
jgi:hypothetical protein